MNNLINKQWVFIFLASLSSSHAFAGAEGMHSMPKLQEKKTYSVQSKDQGQELLDKRGFGDQEPEIRMMNLMMVGGSGYEGMDMNLAMTSGETKSMHMHSEQKPHMEQKEALVDMVLTKSPKPIKVGPNIFEFSILDKKTKKPIQKLNPTATVFMTSMDMGTESPRVKEVAQGLYEVKVIFSMQGPWAIKINSGSDEKTFDIQVKK